MDVLAGLPCSVTSELIVGDLIKETVNPRSLQSALKNYAEENDGELSEDLEKVVSHYDTYDIMKRKETNKAGKKKGA